MSLSENYHNKKFPQTNKTVCGNFVFKQKKRSKKGYLTICTKERKCILSRIVGTGVLDGPEIELTKYGPIADKYIHQLHDFYDDLSVESYVIMPNHIHIMLRVNGAENGPSRTVQCSMIVYR